ncbi:hypothetical protein ACOSQ2_012353 [Xanthoceras sorbifolium]
MIETSIPTPTPRVTKSVIHFNDNPTLQITPEKLYGKNFLEWSQSVQIFFKSRGIMEHLRGTVKEPEESDPSYNSWEARNSQILINSIILGISKSFLFLSNAKEIWDSVTRTYSKKGKATRIFELKRKIHNTKQGDSSVT